MPGTTRDQRPDSRGRGRPWRPRHLTASPGITRTFGSSMTRRSAVRGLFRRGRGTRIPVRQRHLPALRRAVDRTRGMRGGSHRLPPRSHTLHRRHSRCSGVPVVTGSGCTVQSRRRGSVRRLRPPWCDVHPMTRRAASMKCSPPRTTSRSAPTSWRVGWWSARPRIVEHHAPSEPSELTATT